MRNNNSPLDEALSVNDEGQNAERNGPFEPQWYRRDPQRLARELRCLSRSYEDVFVARTEDHNLAVVVRTAMGFIAIITPHNYPLAPPQAFDLSGQVSEFHKDGDAAIDLSRRTGFTWHPSKSLRDAVVAAERALAISFDSTNRSLPEETG